ncbi:MAG: hypothetical protein MH204_02925 [Fimbriimonadaceae bacterium]|nr:hypothetical protein [Fimbriimonadaceae bacterium]
MNLTITLHDESTGELRRIALPAIQAQEILEAITATTGHDGSDPLGNAVHFFLDQARAIAEGAIRRRREAEAESEIAALRIGIASAVAVAAAPEEAS